MAHAAGQGVVQRESSPEQVLEIVEQVVRDAQELSEDEEEEEEGVSEETSLPEAQRTGTSASAEFSETLKRKREEVAMMELEAQAVEMEGRAKRARVQAAADVARIALDCTLAKNMITEAAFGAQSRL